MIRLIFVWAVRHPGSGYVQGINDLCAPLVLVFLTEHVTDLNPTNIYDIQEKSLQEIDSESL